MCGILGGINYDKTQFYLFDKALESLNLRGPDQNGITNVDNVILGHTRLSILDLSENGKQPMNSNDSNVHIVFNGEIYNYKILREELIKTHEFKSDTDTEVLIYGYIEWGIDRLLEKIKGMFSFCLYDSKKKKIFLVKDHIGEKPLFYLCHKNRIVFSSTINAIKIVHQESLDINENSINEYLLKSFISSPNTIYSLVNRIKPGTYLSIDTDTQNVIEKKYYQLIIPQKLYLSEIDWIRRIENSLFQSIERRLISDVPIGSFLSGGIDSSIVSAIVSKEFGYNLNTYTLKFSDKKIDESSNAFLISKHLETKHSEIEFNQISFDQLKEMVNHFGEPFADTSFISTWIISRFAKQNGTKVILTGDGGDECFAGYYHHLAINYSQKIKYIFNLKLFNNEFIRKSYKKSKYLKWISTINSVPGGYYVYDLFGDKGFRNNPSIFSDHDDYCGILKAIDEKEIEIWKNTLGDWVDKSLLQDFLYLLPNDFIVKVDTMTMASSIEARAPFLDIDLISLSLQMPSNLKLKNGRMKYPLRKLSEKYLPKYISNLPKKGFSFPLQDFILNNYSAIKNEIVISFPFLEKYININYIKRFLFNIEIVCKNKKYQSQLWVILILSIWSNSQLDKR
jgi:asparagine synthase (glutamine-hydrolysing)